MRKLWRQLTVLTIIAVRLSLSVLHTHPQVDLSETGAGSHFVSDAHCLACDLESTAAVEAGPIIILPAELIRSFSYKLSKQPEVSLSIREIPSTRGPPAVFA